MIFISYKSDDANLVRIIADLLIGAGNSVWFAEYKVLLRNYEEFQHAIDDGIEQSSYALFFTNKQWSLSDHCSYEKSRLLKKIIPENCLEIVLNENDRYLRVFFEKVIYVDERKCFQNLDIVNTIQKKLEEMFGFKTSKLRTYPLGEPVSLPNIGVQLRTGPLEPKIGDNQFKSQNFMSPIIIFKKEFPEGTVGINLQVMPFDSVLSSISGRYGEIQDDRKIYKEYIEYANSWISSYHNNTSNRTGNILEPLGLHLYFKEQRSNFALTYYSRSKATNEIVTIERRYVIPIEGSLDEEKGEIGIVFYGQFKGTIYDQLSIFNKYSYFFEEVVESMNYSTPSGRTARVNDLPIYMSKILFNGVAFFLSYYCYNKNEPLYASLLAFVSGIVLRDILEFGRVMIYKRILWMMNPVEDNLNDTEYEQISSTFYIQLYTNVLLLGYGFVDAMKTLHKSLLDILLWMIFSTELLLMTSLPITEYWFVFTTITSGLLTGFIFGRRVSSAIVAKFTNK